MATTRLIRRCASERVTNFGNQKVRVDVQRLLAPELPEDTQAVKRFLASGSYEVMMISEG